MKKLIISILFVSLAVAGGTALAMKGMDHGGDHKNSSMEGMNHGSETMNGTFKHMAMAGDIHSEFQVMELAAMNMKDPDGKTHHVMATFSRNGEKIEKVAGKVKLVSPSGKEQLADLENFGSGVFAANFTINEPGKWGVVCLFKDEQETQSVKFWYPHMTK
ncbi:MAG: hypothetical protein V2I36_14875 [Desulfopila sp.]|nr:hypothetical protein [Desulfopila sp.]